MVHSKGCLLQDTYSHSSAECPCLIFYLSLKAHPSSYKFLQDQMKGKLMVSKPRDPLPSLLGSREIFSASLLATNQRGKEENENTDCTLGPIKEKKLCVSMSCKTSSTHTNIHEKYVA